MIKSHKLIDIWRQKKNIKTQFTWNRKDKSEATRIAYFLVSTEILMNSYSSDIRPIVLKFTDHTSISLFLKLTVHSTYTEKLQIHLKTNTHNEIFLDIHVHVYDFLFNISRKIPELCSSFPLDLFWKNQTEPNFIIRCFQCLV